MLFKWRRQYRAGYFDGRTTTMLPVAVLDTAPVRTNAVVTVGEDVRDEARSAGVIQIRLGRATVRLHGAVDGPTL